MPEQKTYRPEDVDVVCVAWGEDLGLVSMKRDLVLFYCYGTVDGHASTYPKAEITDADFVHLAPPEEHDDEMAMGDWQNWDHVVDLLKTGKVEITEPDAELLRIVPESEWPPQHQPLAEVYEHRCSAAGQELAKAARDYLDYPSIRTIRDLRAKLEAFPEPPPEAT